MTDAIEGVCEKCGAGVSAGEEGTLVCDGCNVATGVCTCEGRAATTWAPPDRENAIGG